MRGNWKRLWLGFSTVAITQLLMLAPGFAQDVAEANAEDEIVEDWLTGDLVVDPATASGEWVPDHSESEMDENGQAAGAVAPASATSETEEAPSTDVNIETIDLSEGTVLAQANTEVLASDSADETRTQPSRKRGNGTDAATNTGAQNSVAETSNLLSKFSVGYFGIFYGPSLGNPSSYQPGSTGDLNTEAPLLVRNYLTLGYDVTDKIGVSGSMYWHWRPVLGQQIAMRDPYVRAGYNGILRTEKFNWYGDVRLHFPVTAGSRDQDMLASAQSFHELTYQVGETPLTLGIFGSIRGYLFGGQGWGNDLEVYLGPNIRYQFRDTVAFTLLYEMGASHSFGDRPWLLYNDGTDLQPGISWDVTPTLNINPYVNIYTGGRVNMDSTAFGMTLSWLVI